MYTYTCAKTTHACIIGTCTSWTQCRQSRGAPMYAVISYSIFTMYTALGPLLDSQPTPMNVHAAQGSSVGI